MSILDTVTERFVRGSREILGDDLVGVYLHGSAAMGCFNEKTSDIDLIVVTTGGIPDAEKHRFMDMVVGLGALAPEKGIEMSIVRREVCDPFVYPTPFELHFSNMHAAWYANDPDGYVEKMNGTDPDLAAHFTILRSRGAVLCGEAIADVFGEVPAEDYFDSIRGDIANAAEDILTDPVYITLNLCRVLAFRRERLVLSKLEGGRWGLENLPEKYGALLRQALAEYTDCVPMEPDAALAADFASYMTAQIGTPEKA